MIDIVAKENEIVTALELFAEGDNQFLVELIQLYLRAVPDAVTEIHSSLCATDVLAVRRHIHSLAGSSGNLGTYVGLECCRRMTMAAHQGDLTRVQKELAAFEREYQTVQQILTMLLDRYSHAA